MSGTKLFEMRRLEALSNTIFGVAMTLLASDLPRGVGAAGSPDWSMIRDVYKGHILTVVFSFIVAGMFWIGHQRRLAHATHAGRLALYGNLLFLLLIVLLPGSTGLYGSSGSSRAAVLIMQHI